MTIDRTVDIKLRVDTQALDANLRRATAALQNGFAAFSRTALGTLRHLGQLKAPSDTTKTDKASAAKKKAIKDELAEIGAFSHGIFDPIGRGFDQMVAGMLRGTETFGMAWRRMAQQMVLSYIQSGIQIVTNAVAFETAKTIALSLGLQERKTLESAAFAESLALHIAHALAWIAAEAAKVFASVFGFLSPAMGPAAAGPAAASMGAVLAVGATVASAAGGFDVPNDTFSFLHAREMVLPADISDGLRGMIRGGGGSAGGAGPNIHIHAMDGASVHRVLTSNSSAVAAALRRHVRNLGR